MRLDDGFMRNRKSRAAGKDARALYVAGLCYCATGLTDGLIPKEDVPILLAEADVKKATLARMVEVGYWRDLGPCFEVPDYLDYNPSRAKVLEQREADKERKQRQRGHTVTDPLSHTVTPSGTPGGIPARSPDTPPPLTPKTKTVPSANGADGYSEDFERTWAVYPRKLEKKAAWKAWKARLRAGVLPGDLERAVGNYAAAMEGKDVQFVKYLATLLNEDRWRDWLAGDPNVQPLKFTEDGMVDAS